MDCCNPDPVTGPGTEPDPFAVGRGGGGLDRRNLELIFDSHVIRVPIMWRIRIRANDGIYGGAGHGFLWGNVGPDPDPGRDSDPGSGIRWMMG